MYNDDYYLRKKYDTSLGVIILGTFLTVIGVISLILMRFRIAFLSLQNWGYWLIIPAFFLFISGIHQIYVNKRCKKTVKNAIFQRESKGSHKLEHIAIEVNINPKDLLRVLLDLRNDGIIKYRFNPDTGEIIIGENLLNNSLIDTSSSEKDVKKFCLYCGQKLDNNNIFCPSCGSKSL